MIAQRDAGHGMRHRADAADGKASALLHKGRIGPAQRPHQRSHLGLVHTPVTRGDEQHRHIVFDALEDDALGNLAYGHAQRVGCLLRGARGAVQHHRAVGVIFCLQFGSDTLHAFG